MSILGHREDPYAAAPASIDWAITAVICDVRLYMLSPEKKNGLSEGDLYFTYDICVWQTRELLHLGNRDFKSTSWIVHVGEIAVGHSSPACCHAKDT